MNSVPEISYLPLPLFYCAYNAARCAFVAAFRSSDRYHYSWDNDDVPDSQLISGPDF